MLRVAIVGCGWAGKRHTTAVERHTSAEVCAVVDVQASRAEALSKDHGVPAFGSLNDLLESSVSIDAVSICTLPIDHLPLSLTAIRAGKHVFCEKPPARDKHEGAVLVRALQGSKVTFGVNYNQRHAPLLRSLHDKVQSEGGVHLMHIGMYQHGPRRISERINEYYLLTDSCCHIIDTMVYLNGPIEAVHAMGARRNSAIVSDVAANVRFSNESLGSFEHSFVGASKSQHPFHILEVTTEKARHVLHNLYGGLFTFAHDEEQVVASTPSVFEDRSYGDSIIRSVHSWIDHVERNEEPETGLDLSMHNLDIVSACIESIETGRVVHTAGEAGNGKIG